MKISSTLKQALCGNEIAFLNILYQIGDKTLSIADLNYVINTVTEDNKYLTYLKVCIYRFGFPGVEMNQKKSRKLLKTLLGKQFFYAEVLMSIHDAESVDIDIETNEFFKHALIAQNPLAIFLFFTGFKIKLTDDIRNQLVQACEVLSYAKSAYKILLQSQYKDSVETGIRSLHDNLMALPAQLTALHEDYLKREEELKKDKWNKFYTFYAVPSGINLSIAKSEPQDTTLRELARTWFKLALLFESIDSYSMFEALHEAYKLDQANRETVIRKLSQQIYQSIRNPFDSFFKKSADFENFGEIQKYFAFVENQFALATKQLAKTEALPALSQIESHIKKLHVLILNLDFLDQEFKCYFKGPQINKFNEMLGNIKRHEALLHYQLVEMKKKFTIAIRIENGAQQTSSASASALKSTESLTAVVKKNHELVEQTLHIINVYLEPQFQASASGSMEEKQEQAAIKSTTGSELEKGKEPEVSPLIARIMNSQ